MNNINEERHPQSLIENVIPVSCEPPLPIRGEMKKLASSGGELLKFLARNLHTVISIWVGGSRMDPRLREKIILKVSMINRCRYCTFVHKNWAGFLGMETGNDVIAESQREGLILDLVQAIVLADEKSRSEIEENLIKVTRAGEISDVILLTKLFMRINSFNNSFDRILNRTLGKAKDHSADRS